MVVVLLTVIVLLMWLMMVAVWLTKLSGDAELDTDFDVATGAGGCVGDVFRSTRTETDVHAGTSGAGEFKKVVAVRDSDITVDVATGQPFPHARLGPCRVIGHCSTRLETCATRSQHASPS